MGYSISLVASLFEIAAEDKARVLKEVKEQLIGRKYGYVVASETLACDTLEELLEEWGWEPTTNEAGDIVDLAFAAEKMGEDEVLWKVIAPWVRNGSYLEIVGEEGERWRWIFEAGTCIHKAAKIVWD